MKRVVERWSWGEYLRLETDEDEYDVEADAAVARREIAMLMSRDLQARFAEAGERRLDHAQAAYDNTAYLRAVKLAADIVDR